MGEVQNSTSLFDRPADLSILLTLDVTEIHPITYGQGQEYHFLGHQS